jgi:hypothetical protein
MMGCQCRDLKFANGLFIALATMLITLAIGWLAAFAWPHELV